MEKPTFFRVWYYNQGYKMSDYFEGETSSDAIITWKKMLKKLGIEKKCTLIRTEKISLDQFDKCISGGVFYKKEFENIKL